MRRFLQGVDGREKGGGQPPFPSQQLLWLPEGSPPPRVVYKDPGQYRRPVDQAGPRGQLIKEVAGRTNDKAGDGTTTPRPPAPPVARTVLWNHCLTAPNQRSVAWLN